jgi:hypothetical protein
MLLPWKLKRLPPAESGATVGDPYARWDATGRHGLERYGLERY